MVPISTFIDHSSRQRQGESLPLTSVADDIVIENKPHSFTKESTQFILRVRPELVCTYIDQQSDWSRDVASELDQPFDWSRVRPSAS